VYLLDLLQKLPSGEPQFPILKVCISLLLSLPFSIASAERIFSFMKEMKLTKTPLRSPYMKNL
jgi:hypothetical protein